MDLKQRQLDAVRRVERLAGNTQLTVKVASLAVALPIVPAPEPIVIPAPDLMDVVKGHVDSLVAAIHGLSERSEALTVEMADRMNESIHGLNANISTVQIGQAAIVSELRKPVIPKYDAKTGRLIAAQRG